MLIDSHCHLAGKDFRSDLDAVVTRARAAGVSRALTILAADDDEELTRAGDVLRRWPEVRFSIGVHPHASGAFSSNPRAAAASVESAMAKQPLTRALGETGLDYHYDFSPKEVQRSVFREQIRLAKRVRLPMVIHTREAEEDTFRILQAEGAGEVGGVFHCFTGDRAMARRALDAGFDLSLSGIVTFPRSLELREVARMVPLERLHIETDSPFLAPLPHRGKRNEPANVALVAAAIAALRGITPEAVGEAASVNFNRLFHP